MTTDNYVIKLKVATFLSVVAAVAGASIHVTHTLAKLDHLEDRMEFLEEKLEADTQRNAKAIEKLQK